MACAAAPLGSSCVQGLFRVSLISKLALGAGEAEAAAWAERAPQAWVVAAEAGALQVCREGVQVCVRVCALRALSVLRSLYDAPGMRCGAGG